MSNRLVAEAAAFTHTKKDEDLYRYRDWNSELKQSSGSSTATVIGVNYV